MAKQKVSLEEEIRKLEKKTEEAAQKPINQEIEELELIKARLEALKEEQDQKAGK